MVDEHAPRNPRSTSRAICGLVLAVGAFAPIARGEPSAPRVGTADLDPSNDLLVGPPGSIADCATRLEAAGIAASPATLRVRHVRGGFECGAPEAVTYRSGPERIRFSPAPVLSCGMALAVARLERVVEEEAMRTLGSRVVRIEQGGTYSCRKMARFKLVSEHSYGNAIDVRAFVLANGKRITVEHNFGRPGEEPSRPSGAFLRAVARRLYDEGIFSVVLTRFFDELHRDHFHLDLARYRIDGTR